MSIESTGSSARRLHWYGFALAALLAGFCSLALPAAATAPPTRLPVTENEKEVFNAIKSNQFQAAVNALLKAPEGKRVAVAELADEHGMTTLHWAASHRNAAAMRWVLDKSAEVDLKDDQGRTPLMIALDNLDTNTMTLLISRGANTSLALPGHDERLRAFKNTSDIVDFMIWTDAAAAAAELYQKTCSTQQPDPCLKLGRRYDTGDGVPKDPAKAAALYGTACDAGAETVQACHWLAWLLMKGEGVPKDKAKAVALYTKACDGGYANGCYMLALFYNEGKELAKDDAKTVALLTKACNGWILAACTNLGYRYQSGQGVTKDLPKAAALYQKACSTDEPVACLNLGLLYMEGESVPKDQAKAAALFKIGCDAGNTGACHNFADLTLHGAGVTKDEARGVALLQDNCAKGYAQSCNVLGSVYFGGTKVSKDLAKADAYFEKACAGDDANGCYLHGLVLDKNLGVRTDKALAATQFAKACKLGEKKACDRLAAVPAAPAQQSEPPAAAGSAASPCKFVRVLVGVDTVASVERDIQARGGSPLTGGTGSEGKFRMSAMNGDYADAGPGVMAVNYDFDAAGPAGRLIAVTISRHVDFGAPYVKLVADRKAALTKVFGALNSKSATEHSGSTAGCALTLHENPDGGWLYEVYRLSK